MLDTRKLRMLSELDRLGTITAVAGELHLTAPGISMQLAALEREVGVKLTERQGRRVALTPAGRSLAQHGHRVVNMLALAEMELASLREGTVGSYALAAFPSAARTYVADAWRRLLEEPEAGPVLRLQEAEPDDAVPGLVRGSCDLAVVHSYSNLAPASDERLHATRLVSEPVWLALPSDHPAMTGAGHGGPIDLADLADEDWVLPHERWSCHEMVQRACGLSGFAPRAVAHASDFSVLLRLVAIGAGAALVPQLTIASLPAGVALCPTRTPISRHHQVLVRRATRTDPGLAVLTQLLQQTAQRAVAETSAHTTTR